MRMKTLSSFMALLLSVSMLAGCGNGDEKTDDAQSEAATASTAAEASTDAEEEDSLKAMTSLEFVRAMGNGINLGNTLETYNHSGYVGGTNPDGFETLWGQPYTTAEMMQSMKDAGFDTIRIPVAWTNGMNFESGDYIIDERLLSRVETVVNYALDADMYVIINDHWDGGWWGMFGAEDTAVRKKALEMYKSMWTQIGERFRSYSYKLIFESANEELGDRLNDKDITGSQGVLTKDECYETTNMINSEFVKLIRSLGGNNEERFLLIAGYNTDIAHTCDERFKMPEDTADSKLLLSVHYYTPWDYCGTDGVNQWGSPSDYDEQNGNMEKLSKFSDEALVRLFLDRRYDNEKDKDIQTIKDEAKTRIEETKQKSVDAQSDSIALPASDDMSIAWIMYASSDYGVAYSIGDTYDPTNCTTGAKAKNVQITGEGTYTVSLDFSECGAAKGVAFSALGISNGEKFFPDYTYTIDEILINGEAYEMQGNGYTCSDDKLCSRVNLYNGWVNSLPEEARTADGDLTDCSAQIMPLGDKKSVKTISVTFTVKAPN